MATKTEIIKELRNSMEFYKELGYEFLPIKSEDISSSLQKCSTPETVPASVKADGDLSSEERLSTLKDNIGDCRRCKLSSGTKNIVFGEGDPNARLMFISEGSRKDDGRPFAGDAGKVLGNLINKMGFRREDVYIASMVNCMPPGGRGPEDDEMDACRAFLEEQVEIIRPAVIISLGQVSTQALLRTDVPIINARGQFFLFNGIPVMPTFHPAYLLKNPKAKTDTWSDAQKVLGKLKGGRNIQ